MARDRLWYEEQALDAALMTSNPEESRAHLRIAQAIRLKQVLAARNRAKAQMRSQVGAIEDFFIGAYGFDKSDWSQEAKEIRAGVEHLSLARASERVVLLGWRALSGERYELRGIQKGVSPVSIEHLGENSSYINSKILLDAGLWLAGPIGAQDSDDFRSKVTLLEGELRTIDSASYGELPDGLEIRGNALRTMRVGKRAIMEWATSLPVNASNEALAMGSTIRRHADEFWDRMREESRYSYPVPQASSERMEG